MEARQLKEDWRTGNPVRADRQGRLSSIDLSVVIVTWNSARFISRCLDALPAACEGLECEVVIYDNASTDGTLELAGGATVIASKSNDGFAAATNRAIGATRG